MLATGGSHSCALADSGSVFCWGNNAYGQLGNGLNQSGVFGSVTDLNTASLAAPVVGINGARAISSFDNSTCAVLADGSVRCWGANTGGQLGNNTTQASSLPVAVSGVSGAVAIALGSDHACAILLSGQVQCWGKHRYNPEGLTNGGNYGSPLVIPGIAGATALATTGERTCAVVAGGRVQCWGRRYFDIAANQDVGPNPPNTHPFDLIPTFIEGFEGAVQIAVSRDFLHDFGFANRLCAVLASGKLQCREQHQTSVQIRVLQGIDDAVAVTLSQSYYGATGCAVLQSGAVKCFSWGSFAVFDRIHIDSSTALLAVAGLADADSVNRGSGHNCAVLRDGTVNCWGGAPDQMGVAVWTGPTQVVVVPGLPRAVAVAGVPLAGGGDTGYFGGYNCAALEDGTVQCWGANHRGQLGNRAARTFSTSPLTVPDVTRAASLVTGLVSACALTTDRRVTCWGGAGNSPWQLDNVSDAVALTSFVFDLCALRSNGDVSCWSDLGAAATRNASPVPGISQAVAIAGVDTQTCALLATGEVDCWSKNQTPKRIAGLSNVTSLSKANRCAVVGGQSAPAQLWCWDRNGLLDTAPTAVAVPQVVAGRCPKPEFTSFDCLDGRTPNTVPGWGQLRMASDAVFEPNRGGCALVTDGSVKCMGRDTFGELGTGRPTGYDPAPVLGAGGTGYLQLGIGKTAQEADTVFTWAETAHADVFVATDTPSVALPGFRVRAYANSHYLGINDGGTPRLLYKGPLSKHGILDLGSLAYWLGQARTK